MIHFGHGQLAHGVFGVFWVAAAEVDVLDVAHFEEMGERCGGGGGAVGSVLWGSSRARIVMR